MIFKLKTESAENFLGTFSLKMRTGFVAGAH